MSSKLAKICFPLLGVATFVAAWDVAACLKPTLLPHSWQVGAAVGELVADPQIRADFWRTIGRTLLALAIAVGAGVPLGLTIGAAKPLNRMFSGPLDFLRSLPGFALLPMWLSLFKSGDTARLAMVAFGAGLLVVANTAFGVAHIRRERVEVAQVYGASRGFILLNVIAREVLPQVVDGMRLAISLGLVLMIVGEIMLGARGVGTRVNDTLMGWDLPQMYALLFMVGVLGYLFNLAGKAATSRLTAYGKHL